jgi:hypothetical protein
MFKGIDPSRPFPRTGLSSETWRDVPVRFVDIRDLVLTQDGVKFESVLNPGEPVGGDRYAHVIFWNRTYYLEDGHHRVMRAALEGIWRIQARVLIM